MLVHRYYELYRRYNYTTPKSFLELIALYKQLLAIKREQLKQGKDRLERGVDKITSVRALAQSFCATFKSYLKCHLQRLQATRAVEDLQKNLEEEQVVVDQKRAKTQVR